MYVTNNRGNLKKQNFIRDGAFRALAEEIESSSNVQDFVTTSTTDPSAKEAVGFIIPLTENPYAIVPAESIHSRTLGAIA